MATSGLLRRVALVITDVSEEVSVSFIRMTRIFELVTTLAVTSNRRTLRRNNLTTMRNIPEDAILHSHRREDLKSHTSSLVYHLRMCAHAFDVTNNFYCK
jgi:hypothetical protein